MSQLIPTADVCQHIARLFPKDKLDIDLWIETIDEGGNSPFVDINDALDDYLEFMDK